MRSATIRNLMVVVLVACIDGSFIHDCLMDDAYFLFHSWPQLYRFVFAGSVPMLTAAVIAGAFALPGRGPARPFLCGFTLAGTLAFFTMMGLGLVVPWDWFIPLYRMLQNRSWGWYLAYGTQMRHSDFVFIIHMACFITLFSTPELLVATAGGLYARRRARHRSRREAIRIQNLIARLHDVTDPRS